MSCEGREGFFFFLSWTSNVSNINLQHTFSRSPRLCALSNFKKPITCASVYVMKWQHSSKIQTHYRSRVTYSDRKKLFAWWTKSQSANGYENFGVGWRRMVYQPLKRSQALRQKGKYFLMWMCKNHKTLNQWFPNSWSWPKWGSKGCPWGSQDSLKKRKVSANLYTAEYKAS